MNTSTARPGLVGGGLRGRIGGGPSTTQQPTICTVVAPPTKAAVPGEEDDEWSRGASRPSFACDDRALGEMRLAVGSILESVGFTHAASSALELLTDIGVRYMRKLATTANQTAEMDGRSRATDADVIAGFRTMRVSVDEMNDYMRQVKPSGTERAIPVFPLPIAHTPIVFTPVPAALIVPPPEMAFPGLPPMSTQWLRREDLEEMIAEKEKENDREEEKKEEKTDGVEEVKRMMSTFSVTDSIPSFFSKSATAFGLKKGDRIEDQMRGVGRKVEEMEEEDGGRRRGEKRKGGSLKPGRGHKQFRPAAPAATDASTWNSQQDEPCSSGNFATSASYPNLQQLQSQPGSSAHTPSVPAGPISALRDATRPVLTSANVPLAGALAPEYVNTFTDDTPMRVPGLLAAFGRETSENREMEKTRPSPRPAVVARPPSPGPTYESLQAPPPTDGAPTRLMQLAILRSLFVKDRPLEDQIVSTLSSLKNSNNNISSTAAALPSPAISKASAAGTRQGTASRAATGPSIWSAAAAARPGSSAASSRPGSSGSSRPHTPLPPPPITPRVVIKPPKKPAAAPVITTPLPPLRLKISIGPRPSVDTAPSTPAAPAANPFEPAPFIDDDGTSTAGPSSASTIPLMFSPATAAAAAAAAAEVAEEQREEEEDEESKKKKKKHKKEKKEKKEKKREKEGEDGEERKKNKKEKKKKREKEEDEDGENRAKSRSSAREIEAAPSPAPPEGGPIKLKIRLGPRPTE